MPHTISDSIEYIILVASKDQTFFEELKSKIEPNKCFDFTDNKEVFLYCAWNALTNYFEKNLTLPPNEDIWNVEIARIASSQNIILDENIFEKFKEHQKKFKLDREAAEYFATYWLNERVIVKFIADKVDEDVFDLSTTLSEAIQKQRSIDFKKPKLDNVINLFDAALERNNIVPTGVSFIDSLVGGGLGRKEVSILLGATGSGKTTLSIQTACASAYDEYKKNGKGVVVFISYELDGKAIAKRIISNAAKIPRSKLERIKNRSELSSANDPQVYEREVLSTEEDYLAGEKERLNQALKWTSDYLLALDFSGRGDDPKVGCGGVPEVVKHLEAIQNLGKDIRLVILDWAGVMVRRHVATKNARDSNAEITRELHMLCDDVYRLIAEPFDCHVLVVHQLSGVANLKKPSSTFSHADAEGCKSFGVSAWNSFVLGVKDRNTNIVKFECTKTRNASSTGYRLLFLDGDFCRFKDVTNDFVIDNLTNAIISKSILGLKQKRKKEILSDGFDL